MTNHQTLVKEQLLHMLFGTVIFLVLGAIAVALDLASAAILQLGVSEFTSQAIAWTAHGMLMLDLVLFAMYLARSSWALSKEMFR
jgi:hypothetical protein